MAEVGGEVAGWAALPPVSGRCVYAGVAEVTCTLPTGTEVVKSKRNFWQSLSRKASGKGSGQCKQAFSPKARRV